MLVYFSGDWDVHWGYGILTHGQIAGPSIRSRPSLGRQPGADSGRSAGPGRS